MNRTPNLRRIDMKEDIPFLFQLMVESGYLRGYVFPSCDEFTSFLSAHLNNVYHDFFIITDASVNNPLGVIFTHEFKLVDQRTNITALFLQRDFQIVGQRVIQQFLDYIFYTYPLQKVFCETSPENLSFYEQCGFSQEACLLEYRFEKGQYRDVYVLGKLRETL